MAEPGEVLAVTFTNKAAEEMRERVAALLGTTSAGMWISTFHALCARLLRREAAHVGLSRDFVIYDSSDQLAAVKQILRDQQVDDSFLAPRAALSRISHAKNRMESPAAMLARRSSYRDDVVARVYDEYVKTLAASGALDFDDLLLKTVELFERAELVRTSYSRRFRFVMVDEYQDTNRPQYLLMRRLAEHHRNLTVVGDPDQSIYAWRGADIRNILDFETDFPEAKVVRLEQNYRSTEVILAAASAVIANNLNRKEKRLWTDQSGGDLDRLRALRRRARGRRLRREDGARRAGGRPRRHVGRALPHQRPVARARRRPPPREPRLPHHRRRPLLRAQGGQGRARLPQAAPQSARRCQLEEGHQHAREGHRQRRDGRPGAGEAGRASQKPEVRSQKPEDGRLTAEQRADGDNHALQFDSLASPRSRQPPSPDAGVSAVPVDRAWTAASTAKRFPPRAAASLGAFRDLILSLTEMSRREPASAAIAKVLDQSGYLQDLREERSEEAEGRIENLAELVSAAREYEGREPEPSLAAFVDRLSLLSEADESEGAEDARVLLMTLHAAKGLEFPAVIIAGLEEGLFPHSRSADDDETLEEERRLCYVGMTRARAPAVPHERRAPPRVRGVSRHGTVALPRRNPRHPGAALRLRRVRIGLRVRPRVVRLRGLSRLPPARRGLRRPPQRQAPTPPPTATRASRAGRRRRPTAPSYHPEDEDQSAHSSGVRLGMRVRHPQFGAGTVIGLEDHGDDVKVTVRFGERGREAAAGEVREAGEGVTAAGIRSRSQKPEARGMPARRGPPAFC